MDDYTTNGSEIHVDAVRDAFLSAYGPGEFTHSDANEGAAKVFDGWVRYLKAEAWDEGHSQMQRFEDLCQCRGRGTRNCWCSTDTRGSLVSLADNPYREADE